MIKKQGKIYTVVSKAGKSLGKYPTKLEAVKRLAQVEFFKRIKK